MIGQQFSLALSDKATHRLYYTTLNTFFKAYKMSEPKQRRIAWDIFKQMSMAVKSGKTDEEIYQFIYTLLNDHYYPLYGVPNNESQGRADSRVLEIESVASLIPNFKPETYVDIGCNEGNITAGIGEILGVKECYGIDIKPPNNVKGFTYMNISEPKYPFANASIDFVTILMVLHHLRDPLSTIRELKRIMKPGGTILIREHDIDGENDIDGKIFLDMLHGFYTQVWAETGKQEDPNFVRNYYAKYQRKEFWSSLFASEGFERIDNNYYRQAEIQRVYQKGTRIKNPYYFYYAVYTLP